MRSYYQMSGEEVLQEVNGSLEPLTNEQVREHQEQYGPNELVEGKKKTILQIFLEQYKDFLVIILIIAAVASGFMGDVESAAVILIVITMNAILGTVQTIKAEQSLASLKKLSGPEAKVLRDGAVVQIPSAEVTVGDIVMLEAGDYIPADGRLLECASMKVDESALTGESLGVEKTTTIIKEENVPLGDRVNMVYSGSFVTYGRGSFLVTEIGMETEVGKIAGLLKNTSEKRTPLQVNLDQFGQKLSILILVFCGILFGISILRGDNIGDAFLFAVALAVAAIPEALSSIVTIVLSFGMQKMAKDPRESENPFDSDRKLMATKHMLNGIPTMIVKGAVDVLLDRTDLIQLGDEVYEITREDRARIEAQNRKYSEEGLRVLAFAYKVVSDEMELTLQDEDHLIFLGLVAMMDPPREESAAAVAECKRAGIRPIMITGDHKVTAAAIAKRIGILKEESEACEGSQIDRMSDEELKDFVEGISVYARVSPEHKIRIVRAWQEKGNIVSMTGDGVNDAPALKQADVGVAMGITGSEVSKDAAAMILTDDNFATIVKAVENGRNLYRNIKFAIQFLLSGNFGAILAVLVASIFALPVPFAPVHLLFINLLTDSLPAIALGLEPHSKAVMEEKPRPLNESILTKDFLLRIAVEGVSVCATTMTAFLIGYRDGNALLASTMAFATLCSARLFHGFNCKSNKPVVFTKKVADNKYLIGAFALGILLVTAVVMIPGLHTIFKVQTLSFTQLFTVYGLAALNIPVIQLLKAIWVKAGK